MPADPAARPFSANPAGYPLPAHGPAAVSAPDVSPGYGSIRPADHAGARWPLAMPARHPAAPARHSSVVPAARPMSLTRLHALRPTPAVGRYPAATRPLHHGPVARSAGRYAPDYDRHCSGSPERPADVAPGRTARPGTGWPGPVLRAPPLQTRASRPGHDPAFPAPARDAWRHAPVTHPSAPDLLRPAPGVAANSASRPPTAANALRDCGAFPGDAGYRLQWSPLRR